MCAAVICPAGCVVMSGGGSTVYSVHKLSKSDPNETTRYPCMHVFTHAYMCACTWLLKVRGLKTQKMHKKGGMHI